MKCLIFMHGLTIGCLSLFCGSYCQRSGNFSCHNYGIRLQTSSNVIEAMFCWIIERTETVHINKRYFIYFFTSCINFMKFIIIWIIWACNCWSNIMFRGIPLCSSNVWQSNRKSVFYKIVSLFKIDIYYL